MLSIGRGGRGGTGNEAVLSLGGRGGVERGIGGAVWLRIDTRDELALTDADEVRECCAMGAAPIIVTIDDDNDDDVDDDDDDDDDDPRPPREEDVEGEDDG